MTKGRGTPVVCKSGLPDFQKERKTREDECRLFLEGKALIQRIIQCFTTIVSHFILTQCLLGTDLKLEF